MTTPQRILVTGHRSFAAKGFIDLLKSRGHTVVCFNRGKEARAGEVVTGPVERMHENPHLEGPFDTLINFILLKDDTIEKNNEYIASLLKACTKLSVKHLIHLSSVSVYAAHVKVVDETSDVETNPQKKGAYGALKVATDKYLAEHCPADLTLTMFRPGFILGSGLLDPIIGMGVRMPGNQILCLGSSTNRVSAITRELVQEALARAVVTASTGKRQVLLVVDPDGPPRKDYLNECCKILGIGTHAVSFPKPLWLFAAAGGEMVLKAAGMGISPWKIVSGMCRNQTFNPAKTEALLGMKFRCDWRQAVRNSMDNQQPNFTLPHEPVALAPVAAKNITFLGFGGIIKQKHLPSLKKLSFSGTVHAFDLKAGRDPAGYDVKAIGDTPVPDADLHVLASPGRVHNAAIPLLRNARGSILIEKPLCYTAPEMAEWEALDQHRAASNLGRVFVLHNSRFKANVVEMFKHLQTFNPGKLLHVDVHYQSPSVGKHSPAWRRDERGSQTLLMDYALHWMDLACMFSRSAWDIVDLKSTINYQNQTDLISGKLNNEQYTVNFVLRQGFIPRRCRVLYTFENYLCSLGFFPDSFVPQMSFDSWTFHKREGKANFRATIGKVVDKFSKRDRDESHALAIMSALGDPKLRESLALPNLTSFYRCMFELSRRVYG